MRIRGLPPDRRSAARAGRAPRGDEHRARSSPRGRRTPRCRGPRSTRRPCGTGCRRRAARAACARRRRPRRPSRSAAPILRSTHSARSFGLSAPYSVGLGDLPDHGHERVVLEVRADARQLVADVDPTSRRSSGGADARQQQDLRRADRARRRGSPRARRARPSRPPRLSPVPHAAARPSSSSTPVTVAPVMSSRFGRVSAGRRNASAALQRRPFLLGDLEHRRRRPARARCSRRSGDAGRGTGVEQPPVERPRRALLGDPQLAAGAVELRRAARVVLGAQEVRQHVVPAPARSARFAHRS